MRDITELVLRHVECVRHLWNTSFCPAVREDWDQRDLIADAEAILFDAHVLHSLGRKGESIAADYMTPIKVLNFLHVIPKVVAEVSVNREIESGYWDWNHPLPMAERDDFDFRFIHFFYWSLLEMRNYEFVRVFIADSKRFPDAKGKHALVKTAQVLFMYDDEEGRASETTATQYP